MTSCCPSSNNHNALNGDAGWSEEQIEALYALPLADLILQAQNALRNHFQPNAVQYSTLLNFKTGGCPENCSYCPQSAHYKTAVEKETPMDASEILQKAKEAKESGATRFCMGAAWRSVHDRDIPLLEEIVQNVKSLGLETCMTLGMIREDQALKLKEAGLDYYNHNLDSSKEFYQEIITTRTYQDRLDTLANIDKVGLKTCCGGILGMGESRQDRIGLLHTLSQLPTPPQSIPINQLIPIPGTPLEAQDALDPFEFVRTIAVARIMFPSSYVRIAAGREQMSDEIQALCFLAGANSVFRGEKLLTNKNPSVDEDDRLFAKLGLHREESSSSVCAG